MIIFFMIIKVRVEITIICGPRASKEFSMVIGFTVGGFEKILYEHAAPKGRNDGRLSCHTNRRDLIEG